MALPDEVATLRTLGEVVAWAGRRRPAARIADVVVQDEFTHDVVVEVPGDPAAPWLVFDAT